MNCEAMLFDMGYTLLAPHPSFEQLVVETLATRGIGTTVEKIRAVEATAWREANERVTDRRFTLDRALSYEFWSGFYDVLLQRAGLAPPTRDLLDALYDVFSTHHNYAFYDDVFPVLEQLRGRGVRLGVISNWEGWLHDLLGDRGVASEFECVIVSGTVGLEKPDPAIFELAFRELAVAPQRCVYVGDSVEYDVMPSLSLGVEPVLIDRRGKLTDAEVPCRRITSLYELLD